MWCARRNTWWESSVLQEWLYSHDVPYEGNWHDFSLRARPYLSILPWRNSDSKSARCCCNIRPFRFAARADRPCCRFSSARQRMWRYTTRASSDVFLCFLRSSQPADSRLCPHQEQRTASSPECSSGRAQTLSISAFVGGASVLSRQGGYRIWKGKFWDFPRTVAYLRHLAVLWIQVWGHVTRNSRHCNWWTRECARVRHTCGATAFVRCVIC